MNYLDTYIDAETDLEKLKGDSSRVMANYSRVLAEYYKESESLHNEVHQLKEENEELRATLASLSLYVSAGIGDETTTAQQYLERIKEGIDRLTAS